MGDVGRISQQKLCELADIAREFGWFAAHGIVSREEFEADLRLWRLRWRSLRGDGVSYLCFVFEQAREIEDYKRGIAEYRVERAVWPLFDRRADACLIENTAMAVAGSDLQPFEIQAILDRVCRIATRQPRRGGRAR